MKILFFILKTMLPVFGELDSHVAEVGTYAHKPVGLDREVGKGLITASPLDYHVLSQEIVAKYLAEGVLKPLLLLE